MSANPVWEPVGRISASESVPFSHNGPLVVRAGRSKFPIAGGTFLVTVVAATLGTPATGGPVVADVNKNGATIYPNQANRPTIPADATQAIVGAHTATTVTDGDHITVDIDQVGSGLPGADLVVLVRLQRIS